MNTRLLPALLLLTAPLLPLSASTAPARPLTGRIAAGYFHTCAIVAGGQVKCWGLGTEGEIGNGVFANAAQPQLVKGLSGVQELAAGYHWTCARLADGSLKCWGMTSGKYASPADRAKVKLRKLTSSITAACVAEPIAVAGVSRIRHLDVAGNFLYAIDADGKARAIDMEEHAGTPTLQTLDNLGRVRQISGMRYTGNMTAGCGLTTGGQAICWNSNALYGKYAPNCAVRPAPCSVEVDGQSVGVTGEDAPALCSALKSSQPESIKPMRWSCKSVSATTQECTYLPSDLGQSTHFQVLFLKGSKVQVFYPERVFTDPNHPSNCQEPLTSELDRRPVRGLEHLDWISGNGSEGAYAIAHDGSVFFWGQTSGVASFLPPPLKAQGSIDPGGHPVMPVPQLKGAVQIQENSWAGFALWPTGEVRGWGEQHHRGLVGTGQSAGIVKVPTRLALPPVQALSLGDYHSCALSSDGRVFCWGDNSYSQLGAGVRAAFSALPKEVPGLKVPL